MLALDKLDIIKRPVRNNSTMGLWSLYDANLVGGVLVGVGMALSGACPGTVLVQLAHRIPSANATAAGALLGAALYIWFDDRRKETQPGAEGERNACRKTISDVSNVPEVAIYPLFGVVIAVMLRFTRAGSERSLALPVAGGFLIGCAQAMSLLLTRSPLGVSTAYEHLSRHILNALRGEIGAKPSLLSKPITFSLGIVAGSMALLARNLSFGNAEYESAIPAWQAFIGGVIMTFGARLGGGCTSGHGLSGLSAMSTSSLITVAAMFSASIFTRALLA